MVLRSRNSAARQGDGPRDFAHHLWGTATGVPEMRDYLTNPIIISVVAGLILAGILGIPGLFRQLAAHVKAKRKQNEEDAEKRAAAERQAAEERAAARREAARRRRERRGEVRAYLEEELFPTLRRAGVTAGGPGAVGPVQDLAEIRRQLERLRQADVQAIHTERYGETMGEHRENQKQELLASLQLNATGAPAEISQPDGAQIRARLDELADSVDDVELQDRLRELGMVLDDTEWQRLATYVGATVSALTEVVNGLVVGQEMMAGLQENALGAPGAELNAMQSLVALREDVGGRAAQIVERLDQLDRADPAASSNAPVVGD